MKYFFAFILFAMVFTGCSQVNKSVQEYTPSNNGYTKQIKQTHSKVIIDDNAIPEDIIAPNSTIAVIFPSHTIGKYALEATNSINTYLINRDKEFKLKVYDIYVPNKKNIINVINEIKKDNITRVIAMVTSDDLRYFNQVIDLERIRFYLPLINKVDIKNITDYSHLQLTFGAINYKKQFEALIKYANNQKVVEFFDNSGIGKTLHQYLKNQKIIYSKKIDDNNGRYKYFLENNRRLNNSAVLLNTPIVKSSILLSAINSQELTISKILSTQLNYTPLLFSLTQKRDRKKLIIANSIGNIPREIEEYNKLLGNDLNYSWVNYSTIVGIEFLLSDNINIFKDLRIEDRQVIFPINLYKVGNHSFKLIK